MTTIKIPRAKLIELLEQKVKQIEEECAVDVPAILAKQVERTKADIKAQKERLKWASEELKRLQETLKTQQAATTVDPSILSTAKSRCEQLTSQYQIEIDILKLSSDENISVGPRNYNLYYLLRRGPVI